MANNLPKEILELICEDKVVEILDFHRSGDQVFQIGEKYVLKVSSNVISLDEEKKRNDLFHSYLPTPKSVLFIIFDDKAYYLKEYLPGKPLCHNDYLARPEFIIDMLAKANNMIHNIDISNCPFISNYSVGNQIIHGDLCLPNILINNDEISGIIDLDSAGIGDPYYDYVWSLWLLEYNLKTDKYNQSFINKLNISQKELSDKKTLYLSGKPVEKWDAYYEDGSMAGCDLVRGLPIPDGLYHLACECLVKHNDGEYLLMERSYEKEMFPGYFEATAGGSALKGEDAFACIKRELFEETGILCNDFKLIATHVLSKRKTLVYSFVCEVNIAKESIRPQEGETISYRWVTKDEFIEFCKSDKAVPTQLERLKAYLNQMI